MSRYVLNMTQISLKDAVRCMSNNSTYFSVDKHNNVTLLTNDNLAYSINNDAKYYASCGLLKVED